MCHGVEHEAKDQWGLTGHGRQLRYRNRICSDFSKRNEKEYAVDWQTNVVTNSAEIQALLQQVKRVAVLGIRSERYADRPAFYVPSALAARGLEIIPVPVYEPDCTQILGKPVYRSLAEIPGPVDLVDVFRRATDIPQHVDDLLAKQPAVVWFQAGIRNDAVAEVLARAGIKVVQNRCLMVDYRPRSSRSATTS